MSNIGYVRKGSIPTSPQASDVFFLLLSFLGGRSCVLVRCQSLKLLNRNIEIGPMIESVVFVYKHAVLCCRFTC